MACSIFAMGACQPAHCASTGVLALDQPSIPVKAPDRVLLNSIVRAGHRLVAAGEHGVVIYSDDNGASWRQAQVPVDATLTALYFSSPQSGWAVGGYGVIMHSADGGGSWQVQLDGLRIPALCLSAAQGAVAAGDTAPGVAAALHRANVFTQQGPDKPFLAVLGSGAQEVTAFGAFRMALRTVNGGTSWEDWSLHVDDAVSHHLYDAARIGNSLYLVGEAGLVFRSDDGGDEFKQLASPGEETLFGVMATSDGVLVYGVAGAAYKTRDGGDTWQPVTVGAGTDLNAGIQLASGEILLGEGAGRLFVSGDRGASFAPVAARLPMAIAAMVQAEDGTVVTVGTRGVMRLPANALTP